MPVKTTPPPLRPRRTLPAPSTAAPGQPTLAPSAMTPEQRAAYYNAGGTRGQYQGLQPQRYTLRRGETVSDRDILVRYNGQAVRLKAGTPVTGANLQAAVKAGESAGEAAAWFPGDSEYTQRQQQRMALERVRGQGQQFGLPPGDPKTTMRGKFAEFMGSPWGAAATGAAPGALFGLVAGPGGAAVGAAVGAGLGLGAYGYQKYLESAYGLAEAQKKFDESWVGQVGKAFGWLSERTEQALGTGLQLAVDPSDTWNNLDAAWEASRNTYNAAPIDVRALDPGRWLAGTAPPLINTGTFKTFVDYDLPETTGGLAALVEARKRIAGGEDRETVFADMQARFGAPGQIRDLVVQTLLDPLNFAELGTNAAVRGAARLTGAETLARAARETAPTFRLGPLTLPERPLSGGGLVDIWQHYGNLKRMEPFRDGFRAARDLNWLQRAIVGADITGVLEGTYKPPRPWEFWRLTPESLVRERVTQANNYLQAHVIGSLPWDESFPQESARVLAAMRSADPNANAQGLDPAARAMLSLEGQVVQRGLQHGGDVAADLLKAWTDSGDERTLLHDIAAKLNATPEAVLARVAGGETDALLRQYAQAGGQTQLSAKQIADGFEMFGADKTPYNPEMYVAALLANLTEQQAKWSVDFFKVRPAGFLENLTGAVKAAQSVVLMGLNPGYMINNLISNTTTSIARGALGLRTTGQIIDDLRAHGLQPARLAEGITPAELARAERLPEMWQKANAAIESAKESPGVTGKLRQYAQRVAGMTPFIRLSGNVEQAFSVATYGQGYFEMWGKLNRRGVGLPRMPGDLEQALRAIDARLPDAIYGAAEAGVNPQQVMDAIFERGIRPTVQAHYASVARELGMDAAQVADLMQTAGLDRVLNQRLSALPETATPADVRRVFQDVRVQAEEYLAERAAEQARAMAEHVRQAAGAGEQGLIDPGALLEHFDNARLRLTGTFAAHKRLLEEIWSERLSGRMGKAEFVQRYREAGERLYRRGYFVEETAVLEGLADGLGKAEMPLDDGFLLAKRSQHANAESFFKYKEQELDAFFNLPDEARTDEQWRATQARIDAAYNNLTGQNTLLAEAMDDYLAAAYETRFPGSAEPMRQWRSLVRAHDAEYERAVMATFENARQLTDPQSRHRLWREFDERMIGQRQAWTLEEIAARRAIWEAVPGEQALADGTAARLPESAPIERAPEPTRQQQIIEQAQAHIAANPDITLDDLRFKLRVSKAMAQDLLDEFRPTPSPVAGVPDPEVVHAIEATAELQQATQAQDVTAEFYALDQRITAAGGDVDAETIARWRTVSQEFYATHPEQRPPAPQPLPETAVTWNASRKRAEVRAGLDPEREQLLAASGWKREKSTGIWYKRGDVAEEGRRLVGEGDLTPAESARLEKIRAEQLPEPEPPSAEHAPVPTLDEAIARPRSELPPDLSAAIEQQARELMRQVGEGEPGERIFIDRPEGLAAQTGEIIASPSTYPDWYGALNTRRQTVLNAFKKIIADAGKDIDRAGQSIVRRLKDVIIRTLAETDPQTGRPPEPEVLRWLGRPQADIDAAVAAWHAAGAEPQVQPFVPGESALLFEPTPGYLALDNRPPLTDTQVDVVAQTPGLYGLTEEAAAAFTPDRLQARRGAIADAEQLRLPPAVDNPLPLARVGGAPERAAPAQAQRPPARGVIADIISRSFSDQGTASLVGQRVQTAADLATLSQVYRNPRYETLRYFFTRGDEIVGQTAISARIPGTTKALPTVADELPSAGLDRVQELMRGHGADGYWMVHNHPSGAPTPSRGDLDTTAFMAANAPGFKGHVIIDDTQFTHLADAGEGRVSVRTFDLPTEPAYISRAPVDPRVPHPILGRVAGEADELAELAKSLQIKGDYITLISIGANGEVRGLMELSPGQHRTPERALATAVGFARSTGGTHVAAVLPPGYRMTMGTTRAIREGIRRDILLDAVYSVGGEYYSFRAAAGGVPESEFIFGKQRGGIQWRVGEPQAGLFGEGDDLPLFSGTPQRGRAEGFAPEESAGEQLRLEGVESGPEMKGAKRGDTLVSQTPGLRGLGVDRIRYTVSNDIELAAGERLLKSEIIERSIGKRHPLYRISVIEGSHGRRYVRVEHGSDLRAVVGAQTEAEVRFLEITSDDLETRALDPVNQRARRMLEEFDGGQQMLFEPRAPYLLPPGVTSDNGGMPAPLADAERADYHARLRPALQVMQRLAEDDLVRGRARIADLPPDVAERVRSYAKAAGGKLAENKLTAMKWGEYRRDSALLNYSRRYVGDVALGMIAPYHFWTTHSLMKWALHSLQKPALLANYYRLSRFLNTNVQRPGFPSRLAGRVKINLPWLPEWMGGGVWVDPLKLGLPFQQWEAPWEQMAQQGARLESAALRELETMRDAGEITAEQYQAATASQSGDAWKTASDRAVEREPSLRYDAADLATAIYSPSLPLKWAYEYLRGTPERIAPLPVTRDVKTITAALGLGGPGGVNLESGLRRALDLPVFDQWADYRIDRELANMAAEGKISAEQATAAMIERAGPVYDQAVQREAQQGGADPSVQVFGRLFGGAGVYPEGEQKQRELAVLWRAAREAQDNGDTDALNKFLEANPEYEARLALNREPEQRLRNFLVDQVWAAYMALPTFYRQQVQDQLGDDFNTAFLDSETRSYDSIPAETLATWARTLGRYVPDPVEGEPLDLDLAPEIVAYEAQQYYDERAQRFDMDTIRALQGAYFDIPEHARATDKAYPESVEGWYTLKDRLFPGIDDLLDLYYSLPENAKPAAREAKFPGIGGMLDGYFALPQGSAERREYRAQHPQLVEYWNWEKEYDAAHPENAQRKEFRDQYPIINRYFDTKDTYLKAHPDAADYLDDTDVSARTAFTQDNPSLTEFWDWRRTWLEQHPVTAAWLTDAEQKYSATGAPSSTNRGPTINGSPELQSLVGMYLFADAELPPRVKAQLAAAHQQAGGEGTLDQYLMQVLAFGGDLGGGSAGAGAFAYPRTVQQSAASTPTTPGVTMATQRTTTPPINAAAPATMVTPVPAATPPSGTRPAGWQQWQPMAQQYAQQYGVPAELMLAALQAESGGDPQAMGDGRHSVGLFQLHDQGMGAGLSVEQRMDPATQFGIMAPAFARNYQAAQAQGYAGSELIIEAIARTERPRGWQDVNGSARNAYRRALQMVTGGGP